MRQRHLEAYLFLAPLLITLAIFFLYALIKTIYFSFTQYDLFHPPRWVGLANYIALFHQSLFLQALHNTLIYAVGTTLIQTIFALALAVLLNNRLKGRGFFRTAFYLPSVTSSVVITLIFILLFRQTGTVDFLLTEFLSYAPELLLFVLATACAQLLQVLWERAHQLPATPFDPLLLLSSGLFGLLITLLANALGWVTPRSIPPLQIPWLTTLKTVGGILHIPLPLLAIMILNIWTTAPTFMIYFLAGLQDVPKQLYEAAEIDGAGPWQQFWAVTLPSLRPVLFLVLTLSLIGTLALFDQVAVLGSTAPLQSTITLAYYVYTNVFPQGSLPRVGLASAAAIFLALLTLVVVGIQRLFLSSEAS
jgi:multiple sugar transport system permease protein